MGYLANDQQQAIPWKKIIWQQLLSLQKGVPPFEALVCSS